MNYILKYGLITGFIYCVITLVLFFAFGNSINFTTKFFIDFLLLNLVLYIFLYFPIKIKINSLSEPRFYYGEGMKAGFTSAFVASIVIVIFIFIFYKFINTDFFGSIKKSMIPEINGTDLDSLKKSSSIKALIANSSPVTLMLQQFSFTLISGMIASFILAAFCSRKKQKQ